MVSLLRAQLVFVPLPLLSLHDTVSVGVIYIGRLARSTHPLNHPVPLFTVNLYRLEATFLHEVPHYLHSKS